MKPNEYTIRRQPWRPVGEDGTVVGPIDPHEVLNPSGVPIAFGMSWRTARKIADSLNTTRWQG